MGDPGSGRGSKREGSHRAPRPGSGDPPHNVASDERTKTSPVPDPGAPDGPQAQRRRGTWSHNPFVTGFMLAAGALLAWWLGGLILRASSVIVLIVVSLFIAFGLSPVVEWLIRRNVRRRYAVLLVALGFLAALALFVLAIAPVVADQVAALTKNAPEYFDKLLHNRQIERWNQQYDIVSKAQDYVTSGKITQGLFGGVLGVSLAILAALGNAFIVIVLTLYFLAIAGHGQARPLPPGPRQPSRAGGAPRRPDPRRDRRLRLRRLPGRHVRRHHLADLPVLRRPGRVRRGAGRRGGAARRDPDDRRHPRRGDRQCDRLRDRRAGRASRASSSTSSTSSSRTT